MSLGWTWRPSCAPTASPLFSLESRRSIGDFDIFGISLGWEMTYTNVLTMLDLAGIPLRSQERQSPFPIVMGGGSGALNGEPMADFFDVFLMGEGEEVLVEFCRMVESIKRCWPSAASRRQAGLNGRSCCATPLVFRESTCRSSTRSPTIPTGRWSASNPPSRAYPAWSPSGRVERLLPTLTTPVMPFIQTIHDRASIEIQRGCTRGCRFCQAGIIYRPLRERSHEEVIEAVEELMTNCGYTEFSLVSLSTSDYHDLPGLVRKLHHRFRHRGISISLPSLRVETVSVDLVEAMEPTRKGGFTSRRRRGASGCDRLSTSP